MAKKEKVNLELKSSLTDETNGVVWDYYLKLQVLREEREVPEWKVKDLFGKVFYRLSNFLVDNKTVELLERIAVIIFEHLNPP